MSAAVYVVADIEVDVTHASYASGVQSWDGWGSEPGAEAEAAQAALLGALHDASRASDAAVREAAESVTPLMRRVLVWEVEAALEASTTDTVWMGDAIVGVAWPLHMASEGLVQSDLQEVTRG